MMRVTNSMISKNSMTNMNSNKINVDKLNNQMTSQKKISAIGGSGNCTVRCV